MRGYLFDRIEREKNEQNKIYFRTLVYSSRYHQEITYTQRGDKNKKQY